MEISLLVEVAYTQCFHLEGNFLASGSSVNDSVSILEGNSLFHHFKETLYI